MRHTFFNMLVFVDGSWGGSPESPPQDSTTVAGANFLKGGSS